MSAYWRVVLVAVCLLIIPTGLFAQDGDICSRLPVVSSVGQVGNVSNAEVVVQQMKDRAEMQARLDKERAAWTVQIIPVKYLDTSATLKPLCIFPAEIVPQAGQHVISVRAPAASMSAIADAIKRMDVPQVGPKNVEWTIHVLVASDQTETLRPVPANINAVVEQLKSVLAYKQFYLLDTMFGTTADGNYINLNGGVRGLANSAPGGPTTDINYIFTARISVGTGEPASASVRMSQLSYRLNSQFINVMIGTDVDIPVGKQVVVGKSTSGDRAYILVVSAKVLN